MLAPRKLISSTHPTLHFAHPTLESFIWNNIIRAHVQSAARSAALTPVSVYRRMRSHGVIPDFHTFPFLIQCFNSPPHLLPGKQIHAQTLFFGLDCHQFVQTSLINMYSCCGRLDLAHQVFDEIVHPDLPSWNSIINANVKVGLVRLARNLFDLMPERNVISWSCMINGHVRCGEYKEALALFREMQMLEVDSVRPNEFTMSAVLSACGRLGALDQGKWAHAYIDRSGMKIDAVLGTGLIDMYAKCGSIERARWVFNNLGLSRDVMAWSAMISGFAMHGRGQESLQLFSKMKKIGMRPNHVTFLGVLCACAHGGFVGEGNEYFRRMTEEYGLAPLIQHYGCMVDLYGRAGLIEDAWNIVKSMPMEPDVLVWGALLSGSRMHGDIDSCEAALKKLIELDPSNSGAYVLLSNVYAKMGRWKEVRDVRDLMETKGIKKVPGCSLVELEGILHEFFVGDESHPESQEIYMMLDEIMNRLKIDGYVGNTSEVLLDLEDEGKELALSRHSEKLAVAFCFLKTKPGTSIRIVKNLRICRDCHVVMKMISRVFNREIVVRDCNRFHHFRGGLCSCKDYW
ncbi:pentatricopeptide repeat-containing protein At3g62890 [Tripterygium wilfordii]|uniref:pentatricopeptide repeat-containing protein At3g62890 n=1 Tax=Tripterygium wilfordii TaxID=458696 RepID=UPI0018F80C7F|nr:pentatricopeptide repeat-containing protein At3g62890 [Tripterygium wilfordii]XP_038708224.1 pentatricopeptide repeat-containing protein At3g62890 [Tripterygium wilfordii]